jgi:lipoprotein-anchoring transpeptidase ErfK/SrfK
MGPMIPFGGRQLRRLAGALLVTAATLAPAAVSVAQAPAPPPQPAPPAPPPPGGPPTVPSPGLTDVVLSNETTFTTWTTADYADVVHKQPATHSPRVTRLRFVTSDGFLQPYIALRERIEVRLPMRPNGRTGWVRRGALDQFTKVNTQLVFNRARRQLTLFRNGVQILQAPIGVGKPSTPTPAGHFWITEKFSVQGNPVYGPFAMGTSAYSDKLTDWPGGGVVGVHGTNEPQLVPGDPSHGCVRLHNGDIRRLARLVPVGTPILIE